MAGTAVMGVAGVLASASVDLVIVIYNIVSLSIDTTITIWHNFHSHYDCNKFNSYYYRHSNCNYRHTSHDNK